MTTPFDAPLPAQTSPSSLIPVPPPPVQAWPAVGSSRVIGKTRHPWGVWLLGFTFIYPLIWDFKINKELRDFHESTPVLI